MSKKRLLLGIVIAVVVLLVVGTLVYWSIGLSNYRRGVAAHSNLDVETAIDRYGQVVRSWPAWLGAFPRMAAHNLQVCAQYRLARQAYDAGDYGTACARYRDFAETYSADPLIQLVDEEHPAALLDWAQEAEASGLYLVAVERCRQLTMHKAKVSAVNNHISRRSTAIAWYWMRIPRASGQMRSSAPSGVRIVNGGICIARPASTKWPLPAIRTPLPPQTIRR